MQETAPFAPVRGREIPRLPLGEREVHLWCAPLDPTPTTVAKLLETLSPDERERADRFRFDRHRRRHIVARGLLRTLLGTYTDQRPEQLRFRYGEKGKPSLATAPDVAFNLSHSGELMLLAVTAEADVGADVEVLRVIEDLESICRNFFSAAEVAALETVPAAQKPVAFLHGWTRKEAYIKAIGDGLSMPLDRFDVTLVPGIPARMLALDGDPEKGAEWSLYHLEPVPGYVGAVAIRGSGWKLGGRCLDPDRLALGRP